MLALTVEKAFFSENLIKKVISKQTAVKKEFLIKIWQKRFCTDTFRNKYLCLKSNEKRAFLQRLLKKCLKSDEKRAFLYRFCCKMYLYMYFNGRIFLNTQRKQIYSLNRMHICIYVVKKGIFYQNWINEAFLHRFYRKSSYIYIISWKRTFRHS